MRWSAERFRDATLDEFNMASLGYWRDVERRQLWSAREIVYTLISGNPYIKNEGKPQNVKSLWRLSIDKEAEQVDLNEVADFEKRVKDGMVE